ncbi:hypothetical protein E8E13_002320 [Curvularia kusanoi]|uniref:Uncharacterized protein n=1 Tax=Curvularia kusanoi TaxID=90978 RepID=A0A9P4T5U2_CURKU|nr:hypothetical protein E8E13_002320 [Curvularia kusanoi]
MSLDNRVFAITGGASGIGLNTAKLISQRGGIVCIGDIDPAALKDADAYFSSIEASFSTTLLDVSNRNQVDAWIQSVMDKFGRLDGAANVAGVIGKHHGVRPVSELDDDEWDRIIAVNLTGCMYSLRAELKHISSGGSIVNVTSIHGTKGIARCGAYGASKHGVIALTQTAAKENGGSEIRVNAVAPGSIYTPMVQRYWDDIGRAIDAPHDVSTAFQRQGKAEEVASVIVFLLGPESSF